MGGQTKYKVGDYVKLTLDSPGYVGIVKELERLKGRTFRISKAKLSPTKATNFKVMYELDGCTSKMGVPFTITSDWLQPAAEVDE